MKSQAAASMQHRLALDESFPTKHPFYLCIAVVHVAEQRLGEGSRHEHWPAEHDAGKKRKAEGVEKKGRDCTAVLAGDRTPNRSRQGQNGQGVPVRGASERKSQARESR